MDIPVVPSIAPQIAPAKVRRKRRRRLGAEAINAMIAIRGARRRSSTPSATIILTCLPASA
jgi:hypothetical protein